MASPTVANIFQGMPPILEGSVTILPGRSFHVSQVQSGPGKLTLLRRTDAISSQIRAACATKQVLPRLKLKAGNETLYLSSVVIEFIRPVSHELEEVAFAYAKISYKSGCAAGSDDWEATS